jgi:hypothetical protein
MNSTPDAVLRHALDYVPSKAFLPVAHVSKRFRFVWLAEDVSALGSSPSVADEEEVLFDERKKTGQADELKNPAAADENDERKIAAHVSEMEVDSEQTTTTSAAELRAVWSSGNNDNNTSNNNEKAEAGRKVPTPTRNRRLTNPLQIGNLFSVPWTKPGKKSLNTDLLAYYVDMGWNGKCKMRSVLTGAAARGDIEGMRYIFDNNLYPEDDIEICTIAAAAGQLDALIWLREERKLPWDPTEIHRESSENLHEDVMEYVEKNSEGHKIQLSYGVGLPW